MQLQPAVITTSQHFIQAFSWMLLHSLWQGLLLAMLSGFLLVLAKKSNSAIRYNLLLSQLIFFTAACVFTFAWEWNKTARAWFCGSSSNCRPPSARFFELNANGLQQFANDCIYWVSANSPLIVLVWLLLFVMRSVRLMGSLVYMRQARHRFVYPAPAYWTDRVELLCRKLQLSRAVQLLESGYVKMPMVIGHLKPIILVPMGLMAGLPAGQVEAILLHELAHIRRHDYIVNVLQTIAETIFCFNPGLLWISSVLRDERENCCDDIALAQTKNKKEFVQALISFKEHALYGTNYQVAFPGKKNHLLNRVSRILSNKNRAFGISEKTSFMVGIIILLAMMATAAITGSRHIRDTIVKPQAVAAQSPVRNGNLQKAKAAINISIRRVRMTQRSESVSADSVPASENDSLHFVTDRGSADNAQAMAAVTKASQVAAMSQDGEKRADDPAAEKLQGDRDREQAKKDQAQAIIDQEQARRDQAQAIKDGQGAVKDQAQALNDQQQAARDQEQARLNQLQERKNAEQDARNKEQVRLNEIQSKKNQEQSGRNEQQARLNAIQENKNREQARLNELQTKKNEDAAKKNNVSVQE